MPPPLAGVGNFANVAVLLILMCCFDTITPIHGLSKIAYYPDRLEGVSPLSSVFVMRKSTGVDCSPAMLLRCGASALPWAPSRWHS